MINQPSLLTLIDWAECLSAGENCAAWEQWLESSPLAEEQWKSIVAAQVRLDTGEGSIVEPLLPPERLAEVIGGTADAEAAADLAEACWRSPAVLDEVLSAVRFHSVGGLRFNQAELAPASTALHDRLLALVPPPPQRSSSASGLKNGHAARLPVARAIAAQTVILPESPVPVVRAKPIRGYRRTPSGYNPWLVAAAAGAVAVGLCGIALWLAIRANTPTPRSPSMAQGDSQRDTPSAPKSQPRPVPPPRDREADGSRSPNDLPTDDGSSRSIPGPIPPPREVPGRPPRGIETPGTPSPPPVVPPPAPRTLPPPPVYAFQSAQGAILVDAGGVWKVGAGRMPISGNVQLVSLPGSWSAIEIDGVGTSVWSGAAAAQLSRRNDGSWDLRLDHGKCALEGLPAGSVVHVQTGDVPWVARTVQDSSTLAIVADPLAPCLYVPRGTVAINEVEVATDHVVRWQSGAVLPPEPLAAPAASSRATADPLDSRWLLPPSAAEQKEWKATYGKMLERLAASADAKLELDRLLTASTHARQAALLSQWRLETLDDEGEQARLAWDLLNDRRALVRAATFDYLLDLSPGDRRAQHVGRLFRAKLGDDVAGRLAGWLAAARQGQAPTPLEARELTENLAHSELAVRQVAVSLLLHHTRDAFAGTRLKPPDYDAADSATRRTAAQQQWQQAIRQLFGRGQRNGPAALRAAPAP